ncbi:hypothetical protein BGW42_002033 [Actinomortierella wolfii]|nr:hypothetical protein BGW42_002033 [Actinomortierella wolfii]
MYAPTYAHTAPLPTSKVELKVSCKGLANRDLTSFSDPQVFLFLEDSIGQWCKTPHAKTERIKDTLNPSFVQGLQVDYRFEVVQKLRFVVYDIDDKDSNKFSDQDFQGEVVTDLASIISAPGGQLTLKLYHPKFQHLNQDRGKITIRAEELKESKRVFSFALKAKDLTKKGMFKTAPSAFVVIQRKNANGTFSPVHKTPVVPNNDDPKWKPFNIKESILCNGDPNRELRFDVMSWKHTGTHTLIGSTPITTPAKLSQLTTPYTMPLPGIRDSTALILESVRVHEPPSFVDFMRGGGNINLMVAIDFTQSNGDPNNPTSLHFRHPSGDNDYTRAIRAVGRVLEAYDSDKRIPVYGFGGKIGNDVSFAFPLNFNYQNPEVLGVDNILNVYWQSMNRVQLWGPTNFAPIIEVATNAAKHAEAQGGYTVLLILTDGAITDFVETQRAIRKAGKYPLSIIIVGVGSADFGKMNLLDGDEEAESSVSLKDRDITQFVAARDYGPQNVHMLASALLQELPEQFLEYMSLNNRKPKPIQPAATMYDPAAAQPPVVHPPPVAPNPGPVPGYPHSPSLAPVAAGAAVGAAATATYAPPAAPAPGYPHSPSLAPAPAAPVPPGAPGYPQPTATPPAAATPPSAPGYPPPTTAPPPAAPGYPPPTTAPPATAAPSVVSGYPQPTATPPAATPATTNTAGTPAASAPAPAPAPGYPPAQPYPGYPPAQHYPGYPPAQPYYGYPPAQPGYPPAGHPYPGYPPAQPYYGYAYPPPGHAPYPGQYAPPPGPPPAAAPGAPPTSAPGAAPPPATDPHAAASAAPGAAPVPTAAHGAPPATGHYYQPYPYAYAPPAGPPPPAAPGAPGAPAPAPETTAKPGEHAAPAAATTTPPAAVPPPPAPGATTDALAASVASMSIAGAPPAAATAPTTATPVSSTDASGYVAPASTHRPAAPQSYTG